MSDAWDGIDRRKSDVPKPNICDASATDAAFWNYIVAQLETVNAKLNEIHIDNVKHKAETSAMKGDIAEIKQAFPVDDAGKPDIDGHHDYHGRLIKASKKWSEIWQDVLKKVFGGIAWAIIIFVLYSIWEEIKRKARTGS